MWIWPRLQYNGCRLAEQGCAISWVCCLTVFPALRRMNLHRQTIVKNGQVESVLGKGVYTKMSSPYHKEDPPAPERIDDLMLRDDEPEIGGEEHNRAASSVRDIASRIPESLSAIGRDISRTIEKAISAKDDYVVAVKISPEAQEKLEALVQAGVFRNRAEAAGFLIDEGIKTQSALFERVRQKLAEIERLRAELRGMIADKTV